MKKSEFTTWAIIYFLFLLWALWYFWPVKKQNLPPIINQTPVIGQGWSPNVTNFASSTKSMQASGISMQNYNPQNSQKVCLKFGDGNNVCK